MERKIIFIIVAFISAYTFSFSQKSSDGIRINKKPCFQKSVERIGKRNVDWECGNDPTVVDCNQALEQDPGNKIVYSKQNQRPFSGDCESCYMNGLRQLKVHFENGRTTGIDTTYYESGCVQVVRNHIDGAENGTWTYYNDTSGLMAWQIRYFNGEKEGKAMYYRQRKVGTDYVTYDLNGAEEKLYFNTYTNDTSKIEHYKEGILDGVKKEYFPKSKIKRETGYKNGVFHGDFIQYDEEGNILQKRSYKDGNEDGEWTFYFDDGSLLRTESWKDGVKHGTFKDFTEDGDVIKEENYRKGMKHGDFFIKYPDGQIQWEARYKKDKVIEEHEYDENGNEVRTVGDESKPVKEDDDLPTNK